MKNLRYLAAIFAVSLIFACSKEESLNTAENNNNYSNTTSKELLVLDETSYNSIINSLKADFESQRTPINELPKSNASTESSEQTMTLPPFQAFDIKAHITNQKRIIGKYPEINNFTSLLDIYHKALSMNKNERKAFVQKYQDFIVLIDEVDFPMLTIPKEKAALLNPEGIIKVDDKIFQYLKNGYKVIEDGDVNKIKLLDATKESNDIISVYTITQKATRYIATSGILSHPQYPQLALGYVHYVDYHSSHGYYGQNPVLEYRMGTEMGIFLNGQALAASAINLYSTATYFDLDLCSSENFINGATDGASFSNTAIGYTSIEARAACVTSNHAAISIQADFYTLFTITLANGFTYSGAFPQ